jgi:hypothetical protein
MVYSENLKPWRYEGRYRRVLGNTGPLAFFRYSSFPMIASESPSFAMPVSITASSKIAW